MISISGKKISENSKPFLIAEMSGNHNQSLSKALKIVKAAYEAGADAIKLQTYTADTMTINSKNKIFQINEKKNLWRGQTQYSLYEKAQTPWAWHKKIFDYAKKLGIICFSSPFDESSVDFLEKLNVKIYKIASFENDHYPLLKKVAKTKKPMIISTGMLSLKELKNIVNYVKKNGCKKLILLKCTSAYPADPKDANLLTMKEMRKIFKCEVGLSDHTVGMGTSIAAITMGASVIEKHFKFDKEDITVDSKFSMDTNNFKIFKKECDSAWLAKGVKFFGSTKSEKSFEKNKRSIFAIKDIEKGEKFTEENIRVLRPRVGLVPLFYDKILGKKATKNIKKNDPIKRNFFY